MPEMGGYTPADHASRHEDGGRDEISIASLSGTPAALTTHAADADAHHPEEIPEGRGYYNTTTLLSLPGAIALTWSAKAYAKNNVYYFPIHVRTPITIDQVTFEVTVAGGAGKKARIAIYAADTNWQPGAQSVASAELAIDAVAVVNGALTDTELREGRYLIALTLEDNTTLRGIWYGGQMLGWSPTLGADADPQRIYVSKTYAALADPGTAWDTIGTSATGLIYPVFLQVKTP